MSIPDFMIDDLKNEYESAIEGVTPFIERIYISTDLKSLKSFEGHLLHNVTERSPQKSQSGFLKNHNERYYGVLRDGYEKQRILFYERNANRKKCYIHITNPNLEKLKTILNGANCKILLARYSLDIRCSSQVATRHIYDNILQYAFFPHIGKKISIQNTYYPLNTLPKNIASHYNITKENEPILNRPRVVIKECSRQIREKNYQLSNQKIDRVRISIWKGGYSGANKIPLEEFSTTNLIQTINSISFKKVRKQYQNDYPELKKHLPLMSKINKLKKIKNNYKDLLKDANQETSYLRSAIALGLAQKNSPDGKFQL